MEIWLKQGSRKLRFPVLPSGYTVSGGQVNTTVNINAIGEINLLGKKKLRNISFSSFFPCRSESYCEFSSISRPKDYVDQLEKMKQKGPMKLYISQSVSMKVTIESLEYEERDGTGDIYFTLEFKEYRKISVPASIIVQTETAPQPVDSEKRDTTGFEKPSSYTVKKGDTLSGIARRLMGTTAWQALYEANKATIGSNPNLIQIGMVLTIP